MTNVDPNPERTGSEVEKTATDCIGDIVHGRLSKAMTEQLKSIADTRLSKEKRDDGVRRAFR